MMMNTTLEQLRGLKLAGMAGGLQEQLAQAGMTGIGFEERLAWLVDREVHWRNDKRRERLLKQARLKYPQASLAQYAGRRGHSVCCQRAPRLGEELRIRHGNGTFGKRRLQLAKTDALLLDDWGMAGIDSQPARTCWRSSTTARPTRPRSSPVGCRSGIGMPGSATPPLPMRFRTARCRGITVSP